MDNGSGQGSAGLNQDSDCGRHGNGMSLMQVRTTERAVRRESHHQGVGIDRAPERGWKIIAKCQKWIFFEGLNLIEAI